MKKTSFYTYGLLLMFITCMFFSLQAKEYTFEFDSLKGSTWKKYIKTKELADNYYKELSYIKGLKLYEKALTYNPTDDTILLQIAYGYFQVNDPDKAYQIYKKVILNDTIPDDKHYLIFAEILSGMGLNEDAKVWFQHYSKKHPEDQRVLDRIDGLNKIISIYKDSTRYHIELAPFNSNTYDFSPCFYGDKIAFVSARDTQGATQFMQPKYKRDQSNYLNLFVSNNKGEVVVFDKKINSSFHEGPVTFYDNDSKIIFTRNSFTSASESLDKTNRLKLYYSALNDKNQWSEPVALWFNSDDYSTGHPCVSADGLRLYFSSDKPGGFGKTDLYVSNWINNQWGEPINLGKTVNTEGAEMFPFIDENEVIYFASDGLQGIGGLDIFKIDLKSTDQWPQNMGYPLNSTRDDFGLILKNGKNQQIGYFSSNRSDGFGLDDIYSFTFDVNREISGMVIDEFLGIPLKNTPIQVVNQFSDSVFTIVSDEKGVFRILCHLDDIYALKTNKTNYSIDSLTCDPLDLRLGEDIQLTILKNAIYIKGKVINPKGNPVGQMNIQFWNEEKTILLNELITNDQGEFEITAQPNTNYYIKTHKQGYIDLAQIIETYYPTQQEVILEPPFDF